MLVNCVAYQEGKKLADIPKEDISEYVKRPDCFVWVALKDPEPEELEEMQEEFGLHELAVEDARHGHQRPKIEEYADSLFAVLHTTEIIGDTLAMGEIDIFVGPNYILTVRVRTERGFASVRARCEREPELLKHGAGFVFYALIDAVNDSSWQAKRLADLVRGTDVLVNLIPLNPTPGYGVPASPRVEAFARELKSLGVNVTVRDTRGRDIDAACGQLAAEAVVGLQA